MVSKEDLRQIVILGYLKGYMLEKLLPIVDQMVFHEQDSIFREGDIADRFYMLKRGKILLEKRISDKVTISLGSVKAGFSFGWSTMFDVGHYTTDAICAEMCEVFSVRREKLLGLLNEDHSMGYILNQRLMRVIKKRLDVRTEQFLMSIKHHPEMLALFNTPEDESSSSDESSPSLDESNGA